MKGADQPFISILISLRNESENVITLCQSLEALTYPKSKFEILFGNDDSQDDTLAELEAHQLDNAEIHSFGENETGSFGKQKVLTALAKKAKGEYFLFTDADMVLPPNWIQAMLSQANKNDLTVGVTKVAGDSWWAMLQNLDWLFNERVVSWFSKFEWSLTAWGNNMLISKSAYEQAAESKSNTIVEDVDLLRRVKTQGGRLIVNTEQQAIASTGALRTLPELLHQRKRWMKGLVGCHSVVWLGVVVKMIFWPAMLCLIWVNALWSLVLILVLTFKWTILFKQIRLTKSSFSYIHFLLYECYDFVFYLLTFVFYILPIEIEWKGRRYK